VHAATAARPLLSFRALHRALAMIEINPIQNRIDDLRQRVAALRGFL
jgi:aspartate aminotransferase-like enzyme